jgi:type IV fimbrial biogenesis protein FimT
MKTRHAGFTLLELLTTIAVLAVIVAIGVPNFRDFVRNSRMTAAANDIVTDFNLARSEAIKRGVPVTLCKSQDGATCDADAADPFVNWIVFVDDADPAVADALDGNGEADPDEPVLRQRSISETLTVYTNADARLAIFQRDGFPRSTAAGNVTDFRLCDDRKNEIGVGGRSAARAIRVLPTGRPVVTREIATIEALGGCP